MATRKGYEMERETAALAGKYGQRTPMSGSIGTISHISILSGDASWTFPWFKKPIVIECKHGYGDKNKKVKSIRIQKEWFDKLFNSSKDSAGGQKFYPAFAMKFKFTSENGMSKFILFPFSTMRELIKEMENLYLEVQELREENKQLKKKVK